MNKTFVIAGIKINRLEKTIFSTFQILPGHVDDPHQAVKFRRRSALLRTLLTKLQGQINAALIGQTPCLLDLFVDQWPAAYPDRASGFLFIMNLTRCRSNTRNAGFMHPAF